MGRSPCCTWTSTEVWLSGGGGEDLALARGNGRVPGNQHGGHASQSLDAQRKGSDVQEQDVLDLSSQDAGLDGRSHAHDLVRIDALVRLLAEEVSDDLVHSGYPRGAADQNHFVHLPGIHVGVGQGLAAGRHGPLQQVLHQPLEPRPGQFQVQVLGAAGVGRDERQIDVGLLGRGEFGLGLFRRLLQSLQGHLVPGKIDSLVLLELVDHPVDEPLVDVVAPQVRVTVGGLDLDDPLADLQDRDVEGAAAEVENGYGLVCLLFQTVRQRGGSRLIHQPQNLQAGDLSGVLGGLPLRVVEVGRNGDDGLVHTFAQILLGGGSELLKDHGRHLGRRVILSPQLHPSVAIVGGADPVGDHPDLFAHFVELAPHETLDGVGGVLGVGDGLALGHLTHQPLAALGDGDDGSGRAAAFLVGDDGRLVPLHHRHHGVRGSQIDTDDFRHFGLPPACLCAND